MAEDAETEQPLSAALAPGWLFTPPISRVDAPIDKRYRTLPTYELEWPDFERLCARLLELTGTEGDHAAEPDSYPVGTRLTRLYGTAGQKQDGIDVLSRDPLPLGRASAERNVVSLQAKRIRKVTKATFEKAVDGFRQGKWADRTRRFIYATSDTGVRTDLADVVEAQAAEFALVGIDLVVWDREAMSDLLRERPRLVDDFFGREWVRVFCGQRAADDLGTRMDASRVGELRAALREVYSAVFAVADSGQLMSLRGGTRAPSLDDRFVTPDLEAVGVLEQLTTSWSQAHKTRQPHPADDSPGAEGPGTPSIGIGIGGQAAEVAGSSGDTSVRTSGTSTGDWYVPTPWGTTQVGDPPRDHVVAAHDWLGASERQIIIGDPGAGKSTALRYMVLDLLADTPQWDAVATRWGDRLPIWLPFHYFTQRVEANSGKAASVVEAIRAWFEQLDFGHLMPLVDDALSDDRLLLVVDGLDEWATPDAGEAAAAALETFVTARRVAILLSARPYALSRVTLVGQWQAARLAPLSIEQQQDLATPLFAQNLTPDATGSQTTAARTLDVSVFDGAATSTDGTNMTGREEHGAGPLALATLDASADQKAVNAAVRTFLAEVHASPDLRSMASVPLFLVLLAQLKISTGAELPTRRFDVFNEAVELLVTVHRSRRVIAANVTDRRSTMTGAQIRMVLAHVAYAAQERGDLRAIDDDHLRQDLRDALMSDDVVAMPRQQAIAVASEIADIAEGDVGLLVRLGPGRVGFIHRSLHEHLASEYLADRPTDDERLVILRARAGDARWREVILGTLWATRAPGRRRQIVEAVRAVMEPNPRPAADFDDTSAIIKRVPDSAESIAAAELVAEMVFGPYQVPGGTARDLADFFVDRIERHPLLSHRSALLRHFVAGADDVVVGTTVTQAILEWAVDINPPYAAMIAALPRTTGLISGSHSNSDATSLAASRATTAPRDEKTRNLIVDCILAAMTSLEPDLAWAAATSLHALGSPSAPDHASIRELVRPRLYGVIDDPASAPSAAAALAVVLVWWPNDKATLDRVQWHRSSHATPMRLTVLAHLLGVLEDALTGTSNTAETETADTATPSEGSDGSGVTGSEVAWLRSFLDDYWSGTPEVQSRILLAAVTAVTPHDADLATRLAEFIRNGRGRNIDAVWTVALHAFAHDPAIAEAIAEVLADQEHSWPALRSGHGLGQIAIAFAPGTAHHQLIARAVETRLQRFDHRYRDMLLFNLSAIDQGPRMRRALLDALATPSSQPHWAANALHRHFADDPEVRAALTAALNGPAAHASQVAVIAHEVLGAEPARVRLLEMLHELHDGTDDDPTRRRFARFDIIASVLADCLNELTQTNHTDTGDGDAAGAGDVADVVERTCAQAMPLLAARNDSWHGDAQFNLAIRTATCATSRAVIDDRAQSHLATQRVYRASPDRYLSGLLYASADHPRWRHHALQRTLTRLRVPPPSIRYDLNRILATTPTASHIAFQACAGWADETAGNVKTIASLAYHRALVRQHQTGAASTEDIQDAAAYLSDVAASYGPDHDERRRAAWVGMCVTRTWQQMVDAVETNTCEPTTVSLQGALTGTDAVLVHELAANWDALRHDFGDDLFSHINGNEFDKTPAAMWDAFATVARHFPAIDQQLRHQVTEDPALLANDAVLHWFVTDPTRTRQEVTEAVAANIRTSNNLRDLAVLIAQDPQRHNVNEPALLELVASRFANEPAPGGFGDALLETLAVLQPTHPAVQRLWAEQQQDIDNARNRRNAENPELPTDPSPGTPGTPSNDPGNGHEEGPEEGPRRRRRPHPQTVIAVAFAAAPAELVPYVTTSLLHHFGTTDDNSMFEPAVIRHARRRLATDPEAAHALRRHATAPSTPFTEAVQLATLMTAVPRTDEDPDLIEHCLNLLKSAQPPILVRDLTLNATVSAATSLTEAATRTR